MRAIEFSLNANKTLDVRYGESQFKKIDEFWVDFTPYGGEKTTTFLPNICKDTPKNREVIEALVKHYAEQKAYNDNMDKMMYAIRNQMER